MDWLSKEGKIFAYEYNRIKSETRKGFHKFYLSRSYLVFLKIFLLFVKGGKIFAYEYNWIKSRHEFSDESRRGFKFQILFVHISVSFVFRFLLKERKIFAHEYNI